MCNFVVSFGRMVYDIFVNYAHDDLHIMSRYVYHIVARKKYFRDYVL